MTTKIHALCDALGNPIAFDLRAGHAHDFEEADVLLEKVNADELHYSKTAIQAIPASNTVKM